MASSALPPRQELSQEYVESLLSYDPASGEFRWKVGRQRIRAGQIAGYRHHLGYTAITIDQKEYLAHRLAWLMVHGRWPAMMIDHINRNPMDNRLENLREATLAENNRNATRPMRNNSGFRGVSFDRRRGHWRAKISVANKSLHLGYFDTREEAAEAYRVAGILHHKEFASFG